MLHFFFFSVCKKSEHMTLKCLGYLFKRKKQLFHQKLKKNNKFFLKCHSHLQLFRIGNKGIFYHTWCESSKPLLSDQIVLLIERPTFWLKSRKTMKMHRTKHWQTVREQQKSECCAVQIHDRLFLKRFPHQVCGFKEYQKKNIRDF